MVTISFATKMNIIFAFLFILTLQYVTGNVGRNHRGRIIGGRKAQIEEFPYQASLEVMHLHVCGGSVVGRRLIITAAHCIQHVGLDSPVDDRDLRVRVGTSIGEMGGEVYNVTSVIFHEKYDDKALMDTGDVGLILLDRALAYSDSVQPINLIKRSAMPGQMAYVTGYGSQDIQIIPPINKRSKLLNRNQLKRVLMAVELPIVDSNLCSKSMERYGVGLATDMVCAGGTKGNRDACKGDSGGPMVVEGVLAGLTAWGIGCGQESTPGAYTDLAQYRTWISQAAAILLKNADMDAE